MLTTHLFLNGIGRSGGGKGSPLYFATLKKPIHHRLMNKVAFDNIKQEKTEGVMIALVA
jgi:hypothetical protein